MNQFLQQLNIPPVKVEVEQKSLNTTLVKVVIAALIIGVGIKLIFK